MRDTPSGTASYGSDALPNGTCCCERAVKGGGGVNGVNPANAVRAGRDSPLPLPAPLKLLLAAEPCRGPPKEGGGRGEDGSVVCALGGSKRAKDWDET